MKDKQEARWQYDCFHCRLSWCCGPTCACFDKYEPNPERRVYSIWLKGHPGVASAKKAQTPLRGLSAEVKPADVKVGTKIEFRLCGRPWRKGVVSGFRKYGAIAVRALGPVF